MKKIELEKYFTEYLMSNPKEAEESNKGGLIYNESEFNINEKLNSLYIKNWGIVNKAETPNEKFIKPEWIAVYIENFSGVEDVKIILGKGNPYGEDNKKLFPNKDGAIGFIPYSYYLRLKKKKIL